VVAMGIFLLANVATTMPQRGIGGHPTVGTICRVVAG
jgi:hypothetical protein